MELFLDYASVPLQSIADKQIKFTLDYSLKLAVVIHLCASMEKHSFAVCGLSTMCGLPL